MSDIGTMKTRFLAVLERDDCSDAQAEQYVLDALSRIYRSVRLPSMERQVTLTVDSSNQITVPTDFLELIHMIYVDSDDNVRLQRVDAGDFYEKPTTGSPRYYTRFGGVWEFRGSAVGGSMILHYYGDHPPILSDTDSDPLMVIAPDLVTYGALSYAADVYQDERGDRFEARFQQLLTEMDDYAMAMEAREGYRVVSPGTDLEY